jgi:hypothetical protein
MTTTTPSTALATVQPAAALDAGVPLRDVQEAPPTPTRAPPCATTGRAPA